MSMIAVKARAGFAACLAFGALMVSASVCTAAPITYSINQSIGAGSVVGTIQTDGSVGVLGASNISAYALTLNGLGASSSINNSNSVVQVAGTAFTATLTELLFNYSSAGGAYLLFQESLFSGSKYYCNAAPSAFPCFQGANVAPQSIFSASAQNVALMGNQIIATAAAPPVEVPEPASIALFGIGLAVMGCFARRRNAA